MGEGIHSGMGERVDAGVGERTNLGVYDECVDEREPTFGWA